MDLAVIIPAYKEKFLERSLNSLACQTNKDFVVYVGDDNSPYDLESIVAKFKTRLKISYTKFPQNIGAKRLVKQWARCVSLSCAEKWLWLFSDDDLADPNCVETFYNTIHRDSCKFDVYRFNTRVIDDDDNIISQANDSPFIETSLDMALAILRRKRGNSMPDHIFSRAIYEKCGGFVYTDYAQSADWATSILFSKEKGICSMPEAKISWRLGRSNISGSAATNRADMIGGYLQFLNWIFEHFSYLSQFNNSKYIQLKEAVYFNLKNLIRYHYKGFAKKNFLGINKILKKVNVSLFRFIIDVYIK